MNTEGKKLVVYFSRTGENYNVGTIEKGNIHIIANMIAEATGADMFEIVPMKDYPDSYEKCKAVAESELLADARPAIKGDIAVEDYEVVFIGYPIWWHSVPMCVYTFLEKHNWAGKTVIPFISHEGSGMKDTDYRIARVCKGANVATGKGLAIEGNIVQNDRASAQKNVENWLKELGF